MSCDSLPSSDVSRLSTSKIHQEDHQSWKIKMSHQRNLCFTVFPLWTFWKYVFCQSSHIIVACMKFAISLSSEIHKFELRCHCYLFWDLTWFHQNWCNFFGYPLDLHSFFTNRYKYTRTLRCNLGYHLCLLVLNMNPQQRKSALLQ